MRKHIKVENKLTQISDYQENSRNLGTTFSDTYNVAFTGQRENSCPVPYSNSLNMLNIEWMSEYESVILFK